MLETLGKWKVHAIESGTFRLDGGAMMGSVPKVLWEKTNPADELNRIQLAMRCLLLDDGVHRILIESGMGSKTTEKFRRMFAVDQAADPLATALETHGYGVEEITHVLVTHLHFDHSGGLTKLDQNGEFVPAFPNAIYHISRRNWEAGLHPNLRDRASYLTENYLPLERTGVLQLAEDDAELLPGIWGYAVNGHTTGQQLIRITDARETLVFVADLLPLKSHLKLPWIMGYDLNAALTLEEKTRFLQEAATQNWWLWFYHDPHTAAVRIRQGEKYYEVTEELSNG